MYYLQTPCLCNKTSNIQSARQTITASNGCAMGENSKTLFTSVLLALVTFIHLTLYYLQSFILIILSPSVHCFIN